MVVPPLCARAGRSRGEGWAQHAAGVVAILAGLQVDGHTRMAALLAIAVGDRDVSANPHKDPVTLQFGPEIGKLVHGYRALIRLGQVTRDASDASAGSGAQAEMLRKMLLAMAADLRIVLMRLASRLQTLRWHAQHKVPLPEALSRETLELYAPLANRLGIWQVKWEMEDLAFRFLEPVRYKEIARLLEEKRVEREAFIADAIARVREALGSAGIAADVTGRPKHIYSIWNKMRNRRLDFADLYDLRALRIIVEDIRTCYTVLGLVHHLWTPVPDEFDDYISRPKPNGYRSLHTVVYDHDGRPSRCRSARARCTSSPSSGWRRTGATRKLAPRAGRSAPIRNTTASSAGYANCWPGRPMSRSTTSWDRRRSIRWPTASTC